MKVLTVEYDVISIRSLLSLRAIAKQSIPNTLQDARS